MLEHQPLERLEPVEPVELARRAECGQIDVSVAEWLGRALLRHRKGEPLDVAMGLDRASRMRARNGALIRAAELLGPWPPCWQTADAVATAVRRFEDRVRPFMDDGRELGRVDSVLAEAYRALPRLPRTAQFYWNLLR